MEWQNPEEGFYVGYYNGKSVCKISKHWSGYWVDIYGVKMPIVCESLEKAQARAEEEIKTAV